jgi:carboxymethylenebutenolidase
LPAGVTVRTCRTPGVDPVPYLHFSAERAADGDVIVLLTDIFGVNPFYAFPKGSPGAKVPVTEPMQVAGSIAGPVLGHWGRQDYIDEGEVEQLAKLLADAPGRTEVRWYPDAGHSFLAGLTENDHVSATAAEESWRRTLDFFGSHLGPVTGH